MEHLTRQVRLVYASKKNQCSYWWGVGVGGLVVMVDSLNV